ncbi:Response regulator receiver:Transcriptional regulatory protein, C- terminal [Labilithrix luteola]|uniref:Response regulator receiver:Transcriptional regulatory protein, C-terminal n=1 Tax=Labilithrix luteola TaxID=1391654 RepID=A0A0K1PT96_9BACT|nr:response regulator [Labilithrix luteola]AKU96727.1 Response regulator receiver:Transcriptional regulatory protein, C- terminal [Labilithrix luteola]
MIRGRVLVIDGDEWVGRLLGRFLQEKNFAVDVCSEARAGFEKACQTVPDCIVCNVDLPDIDGFWVARRIRTEGGPVSRTLLLFLADSQDKELRLQALQVGGDTLLSRPVSNDEIVAQINALIDLSRRYQRKESEEPSSTSLAAAFRGDLSNFPLASILMMLEMERRTGTLDVVSESNTRAVLTLTGGLFAVTEISGRSAPAIDVLRQVLSWRTGRFAFHPRDPGAVPPPRGSIGALVLEAMRLEDEKKAAQ